MTQGKMTKKTKIINTSFWGSSLLAILLLACNEENPTPQEAIYPTATTTFYGLLQDTDSTYILDESSTYGKATFIQKDSTVELYIQLENFPPNSIHSVHIHIGSCEYPMMHWNQGQDMSTYFCNERSLGIPWAKPMAGDVGNVSVGYDGSGIFLLQTDFWRLGSQNQLDILSRSIVVHETSDDFTLECDPLHGHNHPHTNAKIACGIIEIVQ